MPTPTGRVTLRDIAKIAQVSHITVSRALRSVPTTAKPTRDRIRAIAKKLGYKPDPMLSALASYRMKKGGWTHQGELAWINTWKNPEGLREIPSFQEYWEGAESRAGELGYRLEEFRLADFDMRVPAMVKVLRARNVQGLILAPQSRNRAHLRLPWDRFSAVSLGFSLAGPRLHVVANAQFGSSVLAMRALRAEGFRRIGYVSGHEIDERTDHNFLGGYLVEQSRLSPEHLIPPLWVPAARDEATRDHFSKWHARHRPEAIVTPEWVPPSLQIRWGVRYWMQSLGIRAGACRVAILSLPDNETHACGICQNNRLIGETAVDQIIGMIHRNERGVPNVSLRVLVEGRWVKGRSPGNRTRLKGASTHTPAP